MTLQERLREHKKGVTNSATWDFITDEAADALDAQAARIAELEGALRGVLTTREHEARMFSLANDATPSDVTSSVPAKEINEYAKACAASSAAEKRAREALK